MQGPARHVSPLARDRQILARFGIDGRQDSQSEDMERPRGVNRRFFTDSLPKASMPVQNLRRYVSPTFRTHGEGGAPLPLDPEGAGEVGDGGSRAVLAPAAAQRDAGDARGRRSPSSTAVAAPCPATEVGRRATSHTTAPRRHSDSECRSARRRHSPTPLRGQRAHAASPARAGASGSSWARVGVCVRDRAMPRRLDVGA
jgi:hypothetical protein